MNLRMNCKFIIFLFKEVGKINRYSTEQRKVLISFFKSNYHNSYSVKQLEKLLDNEGISKSAIYRNVAMMESEGLLCRVANDSSTEQFYRYVDPEHCNGVIHLICEKCSTTHHLNKHISEMISGMALESFGFFVDKQKASIYGICENCSQINA